MTRFLSADWVAAFDAALEHVTVDGPGDDTGLAAADGTFSVAQVVTGGPEGLAAPGAADGVVKANKPPTEAAPPLNVELDKACP